MNRFRAERCSGADVVTHDQWRTRTENPLTSGQISSHSQLMPKAGSFYFGVIRWTGLLPHALVGPASVKTSEEASSTLVAFQLYWQPRKHPLPHHTNVAMLVLAMCASEAAGTLGLLDLASSTRISGLAADMGPIYAMFQSDRFSPFPPTNTTWYESLGRKKNWHHSSVLWDFK